MLISSFRHKQKDLSISDIFAFTFTVFINLCGCQIVGLENGKEVSNMVTFEQEQRIEALRNSFDNYYIDREDYVEDEEDDV